MPRLVDLQNRVISLGYALSSEALITILWVMLLTANKLTLSWVAKIDYNHGAGRSRFVILLGLVLVSEFLCTCCEDGYRYF
jgi:hypothetical protein